MNICIFGDSIAQGFHDHDDGGWVLRLAKKYYKRDTDDTTIFNCGISGDTSDGVALRFDVEAQSRSCTHAVLAIGINDSTNTISESTCKVPLDKFTENINGIIRRAVKSDYEVLMVGPTNVDQKITQPIPWSPLREYRNDLVDQYSDALESIAQQEDIPFVSLGELFDATNYDQYLTDGVHPNPQGHQLIADVVDKAMRVEWGIT